MALTNTEQLDQNRSEIPTQAVTNTPYGNLIAKCLATRQQFTLPQWSTLNERYNILAAESIGVKNGGDFVMKYFTIGIRGWDCDGKNIFGGSKPKLNQHQPIDMNLFAPIPFACRPLTADFNDFERSKYRMRTVEDVDGAAYAFYWIKLASFLKYNPQVNKITRDENGNETPVPYVPKKDDLFNPQPLDFTSEGSVPVSNTYINSSAIYDCSLSQADLLEVANACRIRWGDASLASISESAMVWGIDTKADGQVGQGAVIRYDEILSAVIAHHITERDGRSALNNVGVNLAFDHGASEPMLLHATATATVQQEGNV